MAELVLKHSRAFSLGDEPVAAVVCQTNGDPASSESAGLLATGCRASGIRVSDPLSLLPPVLVHAWLPAIFRLGIRRAKRPIRRRAFLFIA